jgi:hypothetical protein
MTPQRHTRFKAEAIAAFVIQLKALPEYCDHSLHDLVPIAYEFFIYMENYLHTVEDGQRREFP